MKNYDLKGLKLEELKKEELKKINGGGYYVIINGEKVYIKSFR